jgi:hypothetical protein
MLPLLAEIEVVGAPLSDFFAAVGVVVLLVLGATIVSIYGTVKDKTSRRAERLLGGLLLAVLTTGFLGLLLAEVVLLVL